MEGTSLSEPDPKPELILVSDVRDLVKRGGFAWGVLLLARPHPENSQWITWGRAPEDKAAAAHWARRMGEIICGGPPLAVHESFILDAAKNKARVEELEGLCAQLLADPEPGRNRESFFLQQGLAWEALRLAMNKEPDHAP